MTRMQLLAQIEDTRESLQSALTEGSYQVALARLQRLEGDLNRGNYTTIEVFNEQDAPSHVRGVARS